MMNTNPTTAELLSLTSGKSLTDLSEPELDNLNNVLDTISPVDCLQWLRDITPHLQVVQFTSLGLSGLCITDIMSSISFYTPIVFIDTLYHFPEVIIEV